MQASIDDGRQPKPRNLPQPSYWPVVMAAAICFGLWGVLTSVLLIAVGLVGVVVAAIGWIGDLRDETDE